MSILLAALAIAVAWSKMGKKSTKMDWGNAILLTIVGIVVLLLTQGITDPASGWAITIDTDTLVTWISLLLGSVALIRGLIWAITKTDLYKKFIATLDHVEKSCKSLESLEQKYTKVHKDDFK
jgi:cellobiose-specific phosphotransferase system component IIC